MTRAETIESCNSDDLVTVLEMHNRKPYKIIDRKRETKKGVMAESLEELISRGKAKLNYAIDKKVYVVLEEDGTEVDEEEYFQTLPANTLLMLLYVGDRWSPFGPPFTAQQNVVSGPTKRTGTHLAGASASSDDQRDETDYYSGLSRGHSFDLVTLLDRLHQDIGSIVLFSGRELELLSEFDADELTYKYDMQFLQTIQESAERHLTEKREIRDALGLLKIYHNSANSSEHVGTRRNTSEQSENPQSATSPSKRSRRGNGNNKNKKCK